MKISLLFFIVDVLALVWDIEKEGPEVTQHVRTSIGIKNYNFPKLLVRGAFKF